MAHVHISGSLKQALEMDGSTCTCCLLCGCRECPGKLRLENVKAYIASIGGSIPQPANGRLMLSGLDLAHLYISNW